MSSKSSTNPKGLSAFFLHLHPKTVPSETLRFTLSFGLGGMSATLLLILFLSGVLQLLSYSPQTETSYQSIVQMYEPGSIAGFIRNVHYWAGNLLVVVTFLHMVRVLSTGAIGEERHLNWLIGALLFLLVLFGNFSGYLMPWDQLAYWAVTIFTAMAGLVPIVGEHLTELLRGGPEVGQETLANFFAIHVGVIPVLVIILSILHFWLIRKAGGLIQKTQPGERPTNRVRSLPHLFSREAAVGLCLTAVLFLWAAFIDAPLGEEANPGVSPNPAKAAWYFMGLQELLLNLHPTFAVCIVPLLTFAALAFFPAWKANVLPGGIWLGSVTGKKTLLLSFLSGVVGSILFVLISDFFLRASLGSKDMSWLFTGLMPVLVYILWLVTLYVLQLKLLATRSEAVTGLVFFTYANILTLTCIGIWFRGKEMSLIWPF